MREDPNHLNLAAPLFRAAQARPAAPALVLEDRTLSYAQLAVEASRVARWLEGAAPAAARVGVLASRSVEAYAGLLGAAAAGAAYVPLNPKQPPARLASILAQAGLDALVADARGAALLADPAVRPLLPRAVLAAGGGAGRRAGDVVHGAAGDDAPVSDGPRTVTEWSALPPAGEACRPVPVEAEHLAYVMFTSGTTGVPKGVAVSAGAVAHFLGHVARLYRIGPDDRVGQFCELSFDVSVFELFGALAGGAALCVLPDEQVLAPARFIRQAALTVWTSVPSVIAILARLKLLEAGSFPTLRVSFFIGEALPVASARAWQAAAPNSVVDNHYGPTEATVACTMQRVSEPVAETPGRGTVAIGRAYDGLRAEVVSADGRFVADGETGELALSGPQLATGYVGQPELTARRFPALEHPELGRSRWYRTGDLAFRDEQGRLHCLGRLDHQVKVMGHRVELEDLDAHLRAASGTDAVAAVAWPVSGGSASGLVGFVCGATAEPAEIRERLKSLVPPYMVPRRIVALDALPLSASGKIDRAALQATLQATPIATPLATPGTAS